jgi:tetratricopeptide (TPR) repeat protein
MDMQQQNCVHGQWVRLFLFALAVTYAFLAGMKTVGDLDIGWQLATGRYIVQHWRIPSTDVLSYTAQGHRWIYPPLSCVCLYLLMLSGGWAALSWLNACACAATIGLILRKGTLRTAALAILAVPAISFRTVPRAELFTTLLFASSLSILWQYYRRSRGPVWLLPIIMLAWVNLHLGFVAGVVLWCGYFLVEFLELPFAERRAEALLRVRKAAPWFAASLLATLANPWGPRIYHALTLQEKLIGVHSVIIGEWSRVRLSAAALGQAVNWRNPESSSWWLLGVAVLVLPATLMKKRFGAALWLAASAVLSLEHLRFEALFAMVVVVVAGTNLPSVSSKEAGTEAALRHPWRKLLARWALKNGGAVPGLALAAVAAFFVGTRSWDLMANRYYLRTSQVSLFGAGPSWWFPERAARFLFQERLPGQIFNDYDLGGYLAWRLGPDYPDYIDGRYIPFGTQFFAREKALLSLSPDSQEWQGEADRRGINVAIFSLARIGGLSSAPLVPFCQSQLWKPVYLDDVSAIFLRERPENAAWLERLVINCQTQPISPPPRAPHHSWGGWAERYNFYANAGSVFYMLSRDAEAAQALDQAASIFPSDPNLYLIRGQLDQATGHIEEAEREYEAALRLAPTDAGWYDLGALYIAERRYAEAARCLEHSASLSLRDYDRYQLLGRIFLTMNQPEKALQAFTRAERAGPYKGAASELGAQFQAQLAEGRARAWESLGDINKAVAFQSLAVQFTPAVRSRWLALADLYQSQGIREKAEWARKRAAQLQ